jgi:hypothetical protein
MGNTESYTAYSPSFDQSYAEGTCVGLGFFGLGTGDCSSYLDQTLSQFDTLCYVTINLNGYAWNPIGSPVSDLATYRYLSIFNIVLAYVALLTVPELIIIMTKLFIL